ncbi:olfactory receptor 1020 isoform X2 [Cuculus canorus]|uniref:olfactory receptor 1020 isoform X2 n=1 Tax=Cuculus canorus TaxID=55661 RepID=UPI0023AA6CDD|nr:olfactory receptor 1020 isoform X2 [Cuculus canorus]
MAQQNHTSVAEFILEGLSDQAEIKAALFVLFLLVYATTLLGNLGIILVIRGDPRLHTSMYFFLGSLSVVDICFSSVIAPKTLVNFLSERKTISFVGCMSQAFFYIIFVTTECFLLTVMAYDRSYINEMILFSLAGTIELSTISAILVSYIFIFFAILRIRSSEGRQKAFSTCASHLTAVAMLYGTTIFMYLRPTSNYSPSTDKIVSIFYTVVIPMLNPLIYSLRNQEVKDALRRRAERITVRL